MKNKIFISLSNHMIYILLCVTAFNFFLSAQWKQSNFPVEYQVTGLATEGNNIYAATLGQGIFLSTNKGMDWTSINNGIPTNYILELLVNGNDVYAGTWTFEGGPSGLYKSTNNGSSWTYTGSGISNNSMITCFALKDNNIYAGTYWSEAGGDEIGDIYVSSDNGVQWVNIFPSPFPITSLLIVDNYIFAARFFGYPCRSRLDSLNWLNMTYFYPEPRIEAFGAIDNKILASVASEYNPLHISEDYGENWSLVFSPLVKYITTFITVGNNIYAGRQNNGVVFSTDYGTTWAEFNEGMPAGITISNLASSEQYLYAGSFNSGIWTRLLQPVPVELKSFTSRITGMTVNLEWVTSTEVNNRGFIVQRQYGSSEYSDVNFVEGNGTTTDEHTYTLEDLIKIPGKYKYRLKQVDVGSTYEYSEEIEVEVIGLEQYALYQNYPNPFNPVTTLSFSIPGTAQVNFKIYDLLGNEITTLVNEQKPGGEYQVEWNASDYASGVYYYTLRAGEFSSTKKLLLMK